MLRENEKVFGEYRPGLLKQVQEMSIDEIENKGDKLELGQARDGNSILLIERDGQLYRMNSAFRPIQEAERWAAQYSLDYLENIVLLFGLGNGIFAKSLLKKMGRGDELIIYEPSIHVFNLVLEQEDISGILMDSRVHIVVEGINTAEFYFALEEYLSWRNIESLCICAHPEYKVLFIDSYRNFANQIAECRNLINTQKHTDVYLAHTSVENAFFNMQYLSKANVLGDFVGKFPENFPAIIVSAGPSLDKNIEELKRAQGKAFIFAVDSAVKTLLNRGISFDAMITVDAKKSPAHLNRKECSEIPLFCVLMSRTHILLNHRGKKIFVMGGACVDGPYEEMGHPFFQINIGGCVSTAAFSVCEKMGFQKIVLVGQDLAYDGEITHTGGTIKNIVSEDVGQEMVDGWHGGKVRSRYDWLIYKAWFESAIQQLPDVQVIDATEGGALIHGSEVMPLSEVIDTYCTQPFSMLELLKQQPPTFNEEEFKVIREKLVHLEKELKNIQRNSEEAVIICDQAIDLIRQCGSNVSLNKYVKRLEALNRTIAAQPVYGWLDYYITDTAVEDLKDINQMTGSKEQDTLDTYNSARALYRAMIQAVNDLNVQWIKEPLETIRQCFEKRILIYEDAIELIKRNQYNESKKEEKTAQISELAQEMGASGMFWVIKPGIKDNMSRVLKPDSKDLDLINEWIAEDKLCIQEIDNYLKFGFVHMCLQRV